jgi:hypothetical protein
MLKDLNHYVINVGGGGEGNERERTLDLLIKTVIKINITQSFQF